MKIDSRRATADTEVLGDPTCRRFVMCLWELAGATLAVTPTVAEELLGNVRASERRHWVRVLRYQAKHSNVRYDEWTYRRIIDAASGAAGTWITNELTNTEAGGLARADPDMHQDERADTIAAAIPLSCFRRPEQQSQQSDRRIIGEAVALGYTLLATENLGSIKHERTNAWLVEQGHVEEPLIVTLSQAATALQHTNSHEDAALDAVLGAALPNEDRGIERDLRAVTAFIERLSIGHAKVCATWAKDGLDGLESAAARIAQARRRLPVRSRASEARRVTVTRESARQAGYIER